MHTGIVLLQLITLCLYWQTYNQFTLAGLTTIQCVKVPSCLQKDWSTHGKGIWDEVAPEFDLPFEVPFIHAKLDDWYKVYTQWTIVQYRASHSQLKGESNEEMYLGKDKYRVLGCAGEESLAFSWERISYRYNGRISISGTKMTYPVSASLYITYNCFIMRSHKETTLCINMKDFE